MGGSSEEGAKCHSAVILGHPWIVLQNNREKILFLDPSEHLRPEPSFASKPLTAFRDYSVDKNDPIKERVRKTYLELHTNQTVAFVQDRIRHWTQFNTLKVTAEEIECNGTQVTILDLSFSQYP
jgi:hypothetical protein